MLKYIVILDIHFEANFQTPDCNESKYENKMKTNFGLKI